MRAQPVLPIALILAAGLQAQGYKAVPGWPDLPPGWNFGEVPGIAATPRGNVFIFHRGPHPIMEFERNGKFVRAWGDGLIASAAGPSSPSYIPLPPRLCDSCGSHAVRVDPEGNIWIADAGGHVVLKMNSQGRVVMQFGRRGAPGTGSANFNMPTDIAFAPGGDFYVSDGYGNTRVVQFSREGRFIREWGTRGTGQGQFQLPHAIAADAQGRIYVSDRENRRIEVFGPNGVFLAEWANIGGFSGLAITRDQKIWAGGGGRAVLLSLDGKVLANLAPSGKLPGQIDAVHGISANDDGEVYVAELSWRVQKFVP